MKKRIHVDFSVVISFFPGLQRGWKRLLPYLVNYKYISIININVGESIYRDYLHHIYL